MSCKTSLAWCIWFCGADGHEGKSNGTFFAFVSRLRFQYFMLSKCGIFSSIAIPLLQFAALGTDVASAFAICAKGSKFLGLPLCGRGHHCFPMEYRSFKAQDGIAHIVNGEFLVLVLNHMFDHGIWRGKTIENRGAHGHFTDVITIFSKLTC